MSKFNSAAIASAWFVCIVFFSPFGYAVSQEMLYGRLIDLPTPLYALFSLAGCVGILPWILVPLVFLVKIAQNLVEKKRPGQYLLPFFIGCNMLLFIPIYCKGDGNWERVRERAAPVVAALEEYRRVNYRYPDQLSELVPEYLPSIPDSGYRFGREFKYSRADRDSPFKRYLLCVDSKTWSFWDFGASYGYTPIDGPSYQAGWSVDSW